MENFCKEIFIHIALYSYAIEDFVRLWLNIPSLFRNKDISGRDFWFSLVNIICDSRGTNPGFVLDRIRQSTSGVEIVRALLAPRQCTRSGCYQRYRELDNDPQCCYYHPGKLRPTGFLSCCRGKGFRSTGCKQSYHECGVLLLVHMTRTEDACEVSTDTASSVLPPIRAVSGSRRDAKQQGDAADTAERPVLKLPML
jgi:hypothetical protein